MFKSVCIFECGDIFQGRITPASPCQIDFTSSVSGYVDTTVEKDCDSLPKLKKDSPPHSNASKTGCCFYGTSDYSLPFRIGLLDMFLARSFFS